MLYFPKQRKHFLYASVFSTIKAHRYKGKF